MAMKMTIFKRLENYIKNKIQYKNFTNEFNQFVRLTSYTRRGINANWDDRYPCLHDKTSNTDFDRHYIYHPAWAARVLKKTKPDLHIDISSILYFSSIISAFIPIRFYDYRPTKIQLDNFKSEHADLLSLPFENNSIKSLSCMHTVEHIGLGRYGDPLDPDGDLKAIYELKRVLALGGNLLFVVPIGRPKIMFNAHRIYSYEQIINYFEGLDLAEFSLIPDNPNDGGLVQGATKQMANNQTYGCGCFWFKKARLA